jgi:hypothetical protein
VGFNAGRCAANGRCKRQRSSDAEYHQYQFVDGYQPPRYLLLVFDKPQLPVTLTRAVVIENPQSTEITNVALLAAGRATSQDQAIYHWDSPQPITSISLSLEERGTLPVEIAWRASAAEAWRPLTKTVLWNLDSQISAPIPVAVGNVQEIQVTTVNAHLPKIVPQLTGLRPSQTLIFNAQGSGVHSGVGE